MGCLEYLFSLYLSREGDLLMKSEEPKPLRIPEQGSSGQRGGNSGSGSQSGTQQGGQTQTQPATQK